MIGVVALAALTADAKLIDHLLHACPDGFSALTRPPRTAQSV